MSVDILGQVVTNAEARFNKSFRPRKPEGSLGRTARTATSTLTQLLNSVFYSICVLMFMYYTMCCFTSVLYAAERHISVLFIDNKDSVFCILKNQYDA